MDTESPLCSYRIRSGFSSYGVPGCMCLAMHFYSAVVIIVIIYHYSGRERKIVSTDDMGAVCRACCDSWDGGKTSLQDVGLICLNEHAHT